jgi:predicted transcriptional regulator
MTTMNINIPDEIYEEISILASQLKQSPEQCALLALNHFLQTDTVENAIEGIARMSDGEELVDFPELKDELGIEIKFHPDAMDELESVAEEDQIDILEQLITRVSAEEEEEEENTLDLVLKEEGEDQIVLSGFSFGDIVYLLGQKMIIYHIALAEEEMDEEDEGDENEEEEEVDGADSVETEH